jgi:hypothetical protein
MQFTEAEFDETKSVSSLPSSAMIPPVNSMDPSTVVLLFHCPIPQCDDEKQKPRNGVGSLHPPLAAVTHMRLHSFI